MSINGSGQGEETLLKKQIKATFVCFIQLLLIAKLSPHPISHHEWHHLILKVIVNQVIT